MKRFFRFSLLALMLAVTVVAVLLAYVGYYRIRSARFASLQSELAANGGAVTLTTETEEEDEQPAPGWADGLFGENAFAELEEVTLFLNQPAPGLVGRVIRFDSPVCMNAYGQGISDDDAVAIGASSIEELDLDSTTLTPKGYAVLARARQLKHLTLVGGETEAEKLAPMADCASLSELTLIDAEMTPELVAAIAKIQSLRDLFLYQVRWPSAAGWQALGKLAQLETLRITSSKTPAGAAPALRELSNLKHIEIDFGELRSFDGVRVSPEFVQELTAIKSLESLDIGLMKVDPPLDTWPALDGLTKLTQLSLLKVRGVEDFTAIDTATQLVSLSIGEGFSDATLAGLDKLTKLEQLTIEGDTVTDEAIAILANLKTLRQVTLGPNVTKKAAQRLKDALPKCKITLMSSTGQEVENF
ncbi:hypothetical protein [Blastopirellula marina]|uniref:Leucine Rich repeats (2 copies) n=1 Tax=Blastopirellula marina DSM 3645 TaxID=314230 RepID=A3ZYT7_9BACT|nr:hypothetical protein [Blastopirellula marina]EAQ78298.1 hypothetical protein DSM3645_18216 [Blastopirellula marina DSM 3645]